MTFPDITTHDGRRAFSFLAILGGCMANSLYICVVTYLLRDHAEYLFWLAQAANGLLLVGMTALGWAMGRRVQLRGGTDGVSIDDGGAHE